jgi:cell division septation protein DedD
MNEFVGQGETGKKCDHKESSFVWDLPVDAHVVALVHDSKESEQGATVVEAIATAIARRREHTLVLSTEAGPSPLDELMGGVSSSVGLPAVLRGCARLTDIAVQKTDCPFVYLPAGEDLEDISQMLHGELLCRFIQRVQERAGTIFLVFFENISFSNEVRAFLDGYIVLGNVKVPEHFEDLPTFGRVRFDESKDDLFFNHDLDVSLETGEEDESDGTVAQSVTADKDEDGEQKLHRPNMNIWSQHQTKTHFPLKKTTIGISTIALIFLGWWWMVKATNVGEGQLFAPTMLAEVEVSPSPRIVPSLELDDVRRVFGNAPNLPFSVLIASYASLADAEERVTELESDGRAVARLYFVSPTPVRRVLYYRVLAGALADENEADVLMKRLVEAGEKDETSPWHLRPSGFAFDLGVFTDRKGVEARVAGLAVKGIPSYVLVATLNEHEVFQVYGGGYRNQEESLPMAGLLATAGEPAVLIARHGGAVSYPLP